MSDYPMLISNKLHSFRNFIRAKLLKGGRSTVATPNFCFSIFQKIACHIFSKTIVVNNCYSYIYTLNSPTVVNSPLYMPLSPYNRCLNYQAMRLS